MPGFKSETWRRFCDGLSSNIMVQYSVGPIITLHDRLTARKYVDRLGNRVNPMIQMLFPNNDAVFQDDNAPIHTTGTVLSWFEEHEGELQHLPWPAYSPVLNTTKPLWSVLETRVRNRFPPPTSLKQLEDVLQEECYKIPLQTVQNLYESIPRRIAAVLKAKGGPNYVNKETYTVSVVFPLFCLSPYIHTCIHAHMHTYTHTYNTDI
jgi:transposase